MPSHRSGRRGPLRVVSLSLCLMSLLSACGPSAPLAVPGAPPTPLPTLPPHLRCAPPPGEAVAQQVDCTTPSTAVRS